jgi:hypothetical protein
MWADHSILPKVAFGDAHEAEDSVSSWESSLHNNGVQSRGSGAYNRPLLQGDWAREYAG